MLRKFQYTIEKEINSLANNDEPKGLYAPIEYILSMGGKRIRPSLLLLSYSLFKSDFENALPQALAIEVFHNFTLLHDDIMDKAPLRRGKETVHSKWNDNAAILSGDAMMILAYQKLAECDSSKLPYCLNLFNETALKVCEGQQLDMDFESRDDVSVEEYLNMIYLKTSILIESAMKMGAFLADATESQIEQLGIFAKNLGLAFQLQDDILDVFGDARVGKQVGGDIISNKKTFLLLSALNEANQNQYLQLNNWIKKKDFDATEKVKSVRNIYENLNILELSKTKMDYYYLNAEKAISSLNLNSESSTELEKVIQSIKVREF